MLTLLRAVLACGALWLAFLVSPANVQAHAAFERSDPAAGATLTDAPAEIRIWFSEPLEQTYTGAEAGTTALPN